MGRALIAFFVFLNISSAVLAEAPEFKKVSVGEVRGDSPSDLIVGKWEPKQNQMAGALVEFKKNGKLVVSAAQMGFEGTYKFVKKDQLELKLSIGASERTVSLKVKLSRSELTATELNGNTTETFKRVK